MHAAISFAFVFLAFVIVGTAALARLLEPAIFGHVTNVSAYEATSVLRLCTVPLAPAAFALSRQGIDLQVVWPLSPVRRNCHACLVLCVLLHELKSHCCHRFEGIQILHLDWNSHR